MFAQFTDRLEPAMTYLDLTTSQIGQANRQLTRLAEVPEWANRLRVLAICSVEPTAASSDDDEPEEKRVRIPSINLYRHIPSFPNLHTIIECGSSERIGVLSTYLQLKNIFATEAIDRVNLSSFRRREIPENDDLAVQALRVYVNAKRLPDHLLGLVQFHEITAENNPMILVDVNRARIRLTPWVLHPKPGDNLLNKRTCVAYQHGLEGFTGNVGGFRAPFHPSWVLVLFYLHKEHHFYLAPKSAPAHNLYHAMPNRVQYMADAVMARWKSRAFTFSDAADEAKHQDVVNGMKAKLSFSYELGKNFDTWLEDLRKDWRAIQDCVRYDVVLELIDIMWTLYNIGSSLEGRYVSKIFVIDRFFGAPDSPHCIYPDMLYSQMMNSSEELSSRKDNGCVQYFLDRFKQVESVGLDAVSRV